MGCARRKLGYLLSGLLLGGAVSSASAEPSAFAGRWVGKGRSGVTIEIDATAAAVTVKSPRGRFVYPTNGAVGKLSLSHGVVSAKAKWQGNSLVVSTTARNRPVTETWELVDPNTLRITRRVQGKGGRLGPPIRRYFRKS
jgi:hypothetical protein